MKTITPENLSEFRPSYKDYDTRLDETVAMIGVQSDEDLKDYRAQMEKWNRESAIGFSKQEMNIIALILAEEEANTRFTSQRFMDPDFGGNTAEHPIFIGHHIDKLRDMAGFGADRFGDDAHTLAAAKLVQELHARAVFHDAGELLDISYTDQKRIGASSKEPEEEALVGPFKIMLAAQAINQRDPGLYVSTLREARQRLERAKNALIEKALDKEITGDECIAAIGREIGAIVEETTARLGQGMPPLQEKYEVARQSLTDLFHRSQMMDDYVGKQFLMEDKYEGDAHLRHFVGVPSIPYTAETPLMQRMFNEGRHLSHHLASSKEVLGSITYAQKTIPMVLHAALDLPEGAERDVAIAYSRAGCDELLRNAIRLLQKSPPLLDFDQRDPITEMKMERGAQHLSFRQKLQGQKEMRDQLSASRQNNFDADTGRYARLTGVVDTKTIIAVWDKMRHAIRSGEYVPTKDELPLGFGELPECCRPSMADVAASNKAFPLEVRHAYRADQFDGEAVRL